MKRLLWVLLIFTLNLFILSSCNTAESETSQNPVVTTECEHSWQRTDNLNESTAVDECTKCGTTRLYTDPDSMPINLFFSGKYTVSTLDGKTVKENCAVQAVLDLFNRIQWDYGTIDIHVDTNYYFTINGKEVYYHTDSGLLSCPELQRHRQLSDSDRLALNGWIETLFTREIHEIKFLQYAWDRYGISTKTISTCDLAYSIIDALESATETGETVDAISDEAVNDSVGELPVEPGTKWLEVGDQIYRIDPEMKTLCRVESHLGKGNLLTMSEELHNLLRNAWYYHPYDYYSGTYHNETNELEFHHRYTATSAVQVSIQTIHVEKTLEPSNTITLKLKSPTDQTLRITLDCYQSGDNRARGEWKDITLKANQTEIVELTFGGWTYNYWIDIHADNTLISLKIEP